MPGFAVLLSLGVESLGRWRTVGTVAVLALFGLSLVNFYTDPRYDKEDVRSALQYVRTSSFDDEPVAVVGQGLAAAVHYGDGLDLRRLIGCGPRNEGDRRDRAPEVGLSELRSEPVFWLLVSRDWRDRAERCAARMTASHAVRERSSFPGVDLLLLERRPERTGGAPPS